MQVKELGAVVYNCSCLAADLGKIFEAYWFLGDSQSVPSPWPASFSTFYNKDTPLQLPLNGTQSHVYLSVRLNAAVHTWSHTVDTRSEVLISSLRLRQSSPPSLCAAGRTPDLQSILSIMDDAHSFIYIAVMNYLPTMEFSHPKRCRGNMVPSSQCKSEWQELLEGKTSWSNNIQALELYSQQSLSSDGSLCRYWADIDTQLRRVAYEKRIKVRLLVSCWGSSQPLMFPFLKSLATVHDPKSKLDIQVVSMPPGHMFIMMIMIRVTLAHHLSNVEACTH